MRCIFWSLDREAAEKSAHFFHRIPLGGWLNGSAWVHWHWSRCHSIRGALLNADSSPYNAATFHATQCPVVGAVSVRAAGAGSLQVKDRSLIEPGLLLAEMT